MGMSKSGILKGFLRLSLVLTFVMVGINSVSFFKECHEHMDFVLPHLSPLYGASFFDERHWCAIIATDTFLSKAIDERKRIANAFFSENIEPFTTGCLDLKKFRVNFVNSTSLTLEEAPIQISESYRNIPYRDISSFSWHEGLQIWRIVLNSGILLISVIEGIVVSGIFTGIIAIFKWIRAGFEGNYW